MVTTRKLFFITLVCFIFFFAHSSMAADVAKIGVVDLQKVVGTSDAGKAAQVEFTSKGKALQEKLQKKQEAIQELKRKLENGALVMSEEQREELEREYRIKIGDFKVDEKKYYSAMKEINSKHSQKMQTEIFKIVKDLGKKEGYLLIIEKSVVIYSPNAMDVTDKVIEKYNAAYAKKTK